MTQHEPNTPSGERIDPHLRDRAEREQFAELYQQIKDAEYDDTPRHLRRKPTDT